MATRTFGSGMVMDQFSEKDRDNMNSVLRGELSAVETYEQAIPKFDDMNIRSVLSHIRDEHTQAVELLRSHLRDMGAEPSDSSGSWGTFASTVTGAAKMLGPQTTLGALKQGEEYGIGTYEGMLEDQDVPVACKDILRDELLPRCRDHVRALDSMIQGLEAKE